MRATLIATAGAALAVPFLVFVAPMPAAHAGICDTATGLAKTLCDKMAGHEPCTGETQIGPNDANGNPTLIHNPPGCDTSMPVPDQSPQQ